MRPKTFQPIPNIEGAVLSCVHDLKAPLGNIFKLLRLMEIDSDVSQKKNQQQSYNLIYKNIHFMNDLVKGLTNFIATDKENFLIRKVDLNYVMQYTCDLLKSQIEDAHAQIHCEDLPIVQGNVSQLIQLFQNLISNALQYKSDKNSEITISSSEDENYYRLSFKDNGIGISVKYKEKIFNLFERGESQDSKGAGIGLAICQKIVKHHNGFIWLNNSEESVGSEFVVMLPKNNN